jgi:hypothetical protein
MNWSFEGQLGFPHSVRDVYVRPNFILLLTGENRPVYAKKLSIYDFKCFGKAVIELQYPGRKIKAALESPNVNLIVGDNGGGKSSVLRAIAIAALAPALLESGFVPYRLVRRPDASRALLKLLCALDLLRLTISLLPANESQRSLQRHH